MNEWMNEWMNVIHVWSNNYYYGQLGAMSGWDCNSTKNSKNVAALPNQLSSPVNFSWTCKVWSPSNKSIQKYKYINI